VEAGAGDPARALQRLVEAREQMTAGGEVMAAAAVVRAEVAIEKRWADEQGEGFDPQAVHAAQERLRQALHEAQRQGNRLFALRAAVDLAILQVGRGEVEPALALLQQAICAMPDATPTSDLDRALGLAEVLTLKLGRAN